MSQILVQLLPTFISTAWSAFSPVLSNISDASNTVTADDGFILGALTFGEFGANMSDCFISSSTPSTLPRDADPPFPPVFPYLFSTDVIYGRDHLNVNLTMVRLDDFEFDIVATLNGSPINLTGCTLKMTAKWRPEDADNQAVFQIYSPSNGISITDATNGTAHVLIASTLTSALPLHTVYLPFDIQLFDSTSKIRTLTLGTLKVVPDITQATS